MRVSICLSQKESAWTLKYLLNFFLFFLLFFNFSNRCVWTDNQSWKKTITSVFIKLENWSSFWWCWKNQRSKIFLDSAWSLWFRYWTWFELNIIVFLSSFAMNLINKNSVLLYGKSLSFLGIFNKVKFFSLIAKMDFFLLKIFLFWGFDKIFFVIINEL